MTSYHNWHGGRGSLCELFYFMSLQQPSINIIINFLSTHAVHALCGKAKNKKLWRCQSDSTDDTWIRNTFISLSADKNTGTPVNILPEKLLRITQFYSWLLWIDDYANKTDRQVLLHWHSVVHSLMPASLPPLQISVNDSKTDAVNLSTTPVHKIWPTLPCTMQQRCWAKLWVNLPLIYSPFIFTPKVLQYR